MEPEESADGPLLATVDDAVARLTEDAPAGATLARLSPTELLVALDGESTIVTFDEDAHSYSLSDHDAVVRRVTGPGDEFSGGSTWITDSTRGPSVILEGRGVTMTTELVREPETGKWEPQPNSALTEFLYADLVPFGWHHRVPMTPVRLLILVGAGILALVVVALFVSAFLVPQFW